MMKGRASSVVSLSKGYIFSSTFDEVKELYITDHRKMMVLFFIYAENGYGCQRVRMYLQYHKIEQLQSKRGQNIFIQHNVCAICNYNPQCMLPSVYHSSNNKPALYVYDTQTYVRIPLSPIYNLTPNIT